MPVVHQADLMNGIKDGRDKSDPAFLSCVLAIAAYTIAQSSDSLGWTWDVALADECIISSRQIELDGTLHGQPPTLMRCSVLLLNHGYFAAVGQHHAASDASTVPPFVAKPRPFDSMCGSFEALRARIFPSSRLMVTSAFGFLQAQSAITQSFDIASTASFWPARHSCRCTACHSLYGL